MIITNLFGGDSQVGWVSTRTSFSLPASLIGESANTNISSNFGCWSSYSLDKSKIHHFGEPRTHTVNKTVFSNLEVKMGVHLPERIEEEKK